MRCEIGKCEETFRMKYYSFLVILLFGFLSELEAQVIKNSPVDTSDLKNSIKTDILKDSIFDSDTLAYRISKPKKEKKEKSKILETYLFTDSLYKQRVWSWIYDPYFNGVEVVGLDTTLATNKTELPFYKDDVGATYLGITGSATQLHNYFKRSHSDVFIFAEPYDMYMYSPKEVHFMNTKGPYTNLAFYTSGRRLVSEDNLFVTFTRNISPSWNFGLHYQRMGAKGLYLNQATDTRSFTLFTSYSGKRYVLHAGYIYNGIKNKENGGVANDFFITDTTLNTRAIEVRLNSAKNRIRSNTYFLTHSLGLPIDLFRSDSLKKDSLNFGAGTMVYFGHSFEYSRYKRVYTDGIKDTAFFDLTDSSNPLRHYYENHFLSRYQSYDSTFTSQLDNKVFIKLQPYSSTGIFSNVDAGLGYSFESYYSFDPSFYLFQGKNEHLSTAYTYGKARGMFSKYFIWDAFLKYHLTGYRANDIYFDASARLSFYPIKNGVHLEGHFIIDNREASFYTKKYYSNRLQWNNDFDKTTETRLETTLSIPDWSFEAGFSNSVISKPVYWGLDATPHQSADVVNITALYLQKNFQFWRFHVDNRFLMQITSNSNIIPLPAFSGNTAFYLESQWIKDVLRNQLGIDVYYNTKFFDYAYNPAAGMFHIQDESKIGSYPWIDLFASFKWKRANVYVKMTNVAQGMIGGNAYFSALHYPRNSRMIRFGVRWHFFN